jgi:hypothetical protein
MTLAEYRRQRRATLAQVRRTRRFSLQPSPCRHTYRLALDMVRESQRALAALRAARP